MKFTVSTRIRAPASEVWDVLADLGHVADWSPTIEESKLEGDRPGGIGAERTQLRTGTREPVRERIVGWEDGHRLEHEVVSKLPFPLRALRIEWLLEPADGQTETSATVDFKLYFPYGPVGLPFWFGTRRRLRKEFSAALYGLKNHVEKRAGAATGSGSSGRAAE